MSFEILKIFKNHQQKKNNGPNKRGRPAKKCDDDLKIKIEILQKSSNKKATRTAKNTEASRRYRRNLSSKREKIDKELEEELNRFETLTKHHQTLKEEINKLRLYLNANSI